MVQRPTEPTARSPDAIATRTRCGHGELRLKDYTLTDHARIAQEDRGIEGEWLESAVLDPDSQEPDKQDPELTHHLKAIAANGDRILRVVLNKGTQPIRVVTLFFDRTLRRKK
jgi:hypothetical protein